MGMCGTSALTTKLSKKLYTHIRSFLPELLSEINKKITDNE